MRISTEKADANKQRSETFASLPGRAAQNGVVAASCLPAFFASTSKASQRCTVNLRSRFITGTMRRLWKQSSLCHRRRRGPFRLDLLTLH